MGKGQGFKSVVVLAIDNYLIRSVAAALDTPGLLEASIDGLIVFRYRNDVLNSYGAILVVVFVIGNRFIWR